MGTKSDKFVIFSFKKLLVFLESDKLKYVRKGICHFRHLFENEVAIDTCKTGQ